MAHTAQAWATRPSALLGMTDEVHGFLLDEALAVRLTIETRRATERKPRGALPPGFRWATEADYPDDDLATAWADSQGAAEQAA